MKYADEEGVKGGQSAAKIAKFFSQEFNGSLSPQKIKKDVCNVCKKDVLENLYNSVAHCQDICLNLCLPCYHRFLNCICS